MRAARAWVAAAALFVVGCGIRDAVPAFRGRDSRFGYFAGSDERFTKPHICRSWLGNVVRHDEHAITHVSFPETNPQGSCFVEVHHRGEDLAAPAGAAPRGCAYPDPSSRGRVEKLVAELDRVAQRPETAMPLLECGLTPAFKAAAARHNARVLRALAANPGAYPYAAVVVPGHGRGAQAKTKLAPFVPGDSCVDVPLGDHEPLGGMMPRTRRAAALLRGNVAPIAIVSGAAVHSTLNESFAMLHLMSCPRRDVDAQFAPVDADRVLLEPCADHTHTNLRNAGRWMHAIGARAGYVITDDFIQSKYFQDQSMFELLMGSIDQRSLRDWGYVIGSWRQASVGTNAGFWFTPYRFWAEPRDGLGALTCVDEP